MALLKGTLDVLGYREACGAHIGVVLLRGRTECADLRRGHADARRALDVVRIHGIA